MLCVVEIFCRVSTVKFRVTVIIITVDVSVKFQFKTKQYQITMLKTQKRFNYRCDHERRQRAVDDQPVLVLVVPNQQHTCQQSDQGLWTSPWSARRNPHHLPPRSAMPNSQHNSHITWWYKCSLILYTTTTDIVHSFRHTQRTRTQTLTSITSAIIVKN